MCLLTDLLFLLCCQAKRKRLLLMNAVLFILVSFNLGLCLKSKNAFGKQNCLLIISYGKLMVSVFISPNFFFFFLGPQLWHVEVPSQGSHQSCSYRPTPQPQQHGIQAASEPCVLACGNTGSLTQWARPGIEPTSSWTLCQVLNLLSYNGNS